uniref:Lipocalin-like domain-containing protein n=1 Tax=Heterorhabditis bacteriophora TaxID=37862 RepID=A0A1I7XGS2_HETBA
MYHLSYISKEYPLNQNSYSVGGPAENATIKISEMRDGGKSYELCVKDDVSFLQLTEKGVLLITWKN